MKHSWSPSLNLSLREDGSKISFATLPLMNRHSHPTSYWKRRTPLHHWPPWHPHHRPSQLHYERLVSPSHRSCQHCELNRYHVNRAESVDPIKLWFNDNVDHLWIDKQTHWNKSLPKSARMRSTKSVPIGCLWKRIGLVLNGKNQKGWSWIWSKADSWNMRFELSCPSVVQRSVNCTRLCKMVLTRFTSVVHCAFLLMHFMITT